MLSHALWLTKFSKAISPELVENRPFIVWRKVVNIPIHWSFSSCVRRGALWEDITAGFVAFEKSCDDGILEIAIWNENTDIQQRHFILLEMRKRFFWSYHLKASHYWMGAL